MSPPHRPQAVWPSQVEGRDWCVGELWRCFTEDEHEMILCISWKCHGEFTEISWSFCGFDTFRIVLMSCFSSIALEYIEKWQWEERARELIVGGANSRMPFHIPGPTCLRPGFHQGVLYSAGGGCFTSGGTTSGGKPNLGEELAHLLTAWRYKTAKSCQANLDQNSNPAGSLTLYFWPTHTTCSIL